MDDFFVAERNKKQQQHRFNCRMNSRWRHSLATEKNKYGGGGEATDLHERNECQVRESESRSPVWIRWMPDAAASRRVYRIERIEQWMGELRATKSAEAEERLLDLVSSRLRFV